jgi:alpha-beta hydrolase superfamily lysophospholipase
MFAGMTAPSHSPLRLGSPTGWVLYLAHQQPERLIVFVHGFTGGAVRSWRQFADSGASGVWWQQSDMLFVGYDSVRESIAGVAGRLRRELPCFFPSPPGDLAEIAGVAAREAADDYRELLLVGHSLGGVIVRRAIVDCAQQWRDQLATDPEAPMPALLRARIRLFSPASAGFQAAGTLGMLQASPGWVAVNILLRRSSAFSDLQPGSTVLSDTRRRTERLVVAGGPDADALRASIAWANPDDVVIAERYDSDYVDHFIDGATHTDVCRPGPTFEHPRRFVETGCPH